MASDGWSIDTYPAESQRQRRRTGESGKKLSHEYDVFFMRKNYVDAGEAYRSHMALSQTLYSLDKQEASPKGNIFRGLR